MVKITDIEFSHIDEYAELFVSSDNMVLMTNHSF